MFDVVLSPPPRGRLVWALPHYPRAWVNSSRGEDNKSQRVDQGVNACLLPFGSKIWPYYLLSPKKPAIRPVKV